MVSYAYRERVSDGARPRRAGHVLRGRLDEDPRARFNHTMMLYALVAADSTFAVDVFVVRELAERALNDVLLDEPALASLLAVEEIAPPWAHEHEEGATSRP